MHERSLADAINKLTAFLVAESEERKKDIATKSALRAMEARILVAIATMGGGVTAADIEKLRNELKESTDPLKTAVDANPPVSP